MCDIDGHEVDDELVDKMAKARAKNMIAQEIQCTERHRTIEFQQTVNGDLNEQLGKIDRGEYKGSQSEYRAREGTNSGDKGVPTDDKGTG